jgi:hypothetical protein
MTLEREKQKKTKKRDQKEERNNNTIVAKTWPTNHCNGMARPKE